MDLKQLINDDDAVSPVIGVILMVAITVILAAVIATFVLGLGDSLSNTAPQASFSFDYDAGAAPGDELDVTHDGGESIDPANLYVRGDSSDAGSTWETLSGSSSDVTAGGTITIGASDTSTIRITYEAEGSSATLGRWDGPDA
jgi:flagellin-like protein